MSPRCKCWARGWQPCGLRHGKRPSGSSPHFLLCAAFILICAVVLFRKECHSKRCAVSSHTTLAQPRGTARAWYLDAGCSVITSKPASLSIDAGIALSWSKVCVAK